MRSVPSNSALVWERALSTDCTPHALVADDDVYIRMDASDIPQDAGFRVHEASSVQEALAILKEAGQSIQLLFTDVQMLPGELNGFDLARRCAHDWPEIKILVASGMIKPAHGDMPEGAVLISKPFSADLIYEQLQEMLPDGQNQSRSGSAASAAKTGPFPACSYRHAKLDLAQRNTSQTKRDGPRAGPCS
jgi:DNA-binding NtrC family response regulator